MMQGDSTAAPRCLWRIKRWRGDPGLSDIVTENLFDNIHDDPRWMACLRNVGKTPEQLAKIEFKVTPPQAEGTTASGGANL